MGRIVVTEFVSMDGVMQAPGGEEFKYEGWTFDFDRGEDGGRFKAEEIFDAKAQLIGRVTYESFAGAWPKYEEEWEGEMKEFADSLQLDAEIRGLIDPDRPGVEQLHGDRRQR